MKVTKGKKKNFVEGGTFQSSEKRKNTHNGATHPGWKNKQIKCEDTIKGRKKKDYVEGGTFQ